MGILAFFGITIVVATAWHHFLPRYLLASVCATITSVLSFQIVVYIQLGYLDPFFVIAMATSSVLAFIVSLLIGLPIRARRKQQVAKNAL